MSHQFLKGVCVVVEYYFSSSFLDVLLKYLFFFFVFQYSAAGPHTTVNGKDVVNFASANYLGLIGHEKLLVHFTTSYYFVFNLCEQLHL